MIDNSFSLVVTAASTSVKMDGTSKSLGKTTTRLMIGEGNDTRFAVAAEILKGSDISKYKEGDVVEEWFGLRKWVVMDVKDKDGELTKVKVNINSITKRLHITEDRVLIAALNQKDGFIQNSIKNLLSDEHKSVQKVLLEYSKLSSKFKEITQSDSIPRSIMQVTKAILNHSIETRFHFDASGKKFIAQKKDSGFEIAEIGQKLGAGSFGSAFQVNERDEVQALKVAASRNDIQMGEYGPLNENEIDRRIQFAAIQIKNEFQILQGLNKDGNQWGIQKAVHKVVYINHNGSISTSIIGPKYDTDYSYYLFTREVEPPPLREKLFQLHQLLNGLKVLSEKNILHGDIKPENIFADVKDGKTFLYIGDFGGAIDSAKQRVGMGTYTSSYTLKSDKDAITQLQKEMQKDKNPQLKDEMIELRKQMDVFSMGLVLYNSVTGANAFETDEEGFPIAKDKPNEFQPKPLNDLIQSMLNVDPTKRPTAGQALEALNKIIDQDPGLKNEIQALMAKLK